MRSIRSVLSILAVMVVAAALGGCNHTQEYVAGAAANGAAYGFARSATQAMLQPQSYSQVRYGYGAPPQQGTPCSSPNGPGVWQYTGIDPNGLPHFRCDCLPGYGGGMQGIGGGYINGFGAYGYRGPPAGRPIYRRW